MTKDTLKEAITQRLRINCGCTPRQAGDGDMLRACAMVLRDMMAERNVTTREDTDKRQRRQVHYLSLEFLMGRSLLKNAYNLGLVEQLTQAVEELGFKAADLFERQLERLQTDYVDFYLLHSLSRKTWERMLELDVLSLLEGYQRQGRIRRLGFSFHDSYEVFADILTYRDWDFCQIQLNYMDVNHQAGLRGLELARSRGVPVVIMEPVKGGSLAQLPPEVTAPLKALDPTASDASWALRWVASQPGVAVVLSGMSTPEQLEENLNLFSNFRPLREEEERAVEETAALLRERLKNGCTGCRYCLPCPKGVDIPQNFQIWNNMAMYGNQTLTGRAWQGLELGARGTQCVGCGRCEGLCPQHIPIREHLSRLTGEIEAFLEK